MTIYFEHLSFRVALSIIFKEITVRKINNDESNIYYYIEISFAGQKLLKYFKKFFNLEINKLDFELRHIKNEQGELIRLVIHNKDLYEIQERIVQSEEFSSFIHPSWKQSRLFHYIKYSLVERAFLDPQTFSYSKALYLINVIAWYNKSTTQIDHILYLNRIPWQSLLIQYANEKNVKITFLNKMIRFSIRQSIIYQLRKSPRFLIYLRNFNFRGDRTIIKKSFSNRNRIFIESRGHINLLNNGYNSDFFWVYNSEFSLSRIVYKYLNNSEKIVLEKSNIFATNEYTKYFSNNKLLYKIIHKDGFNYTLEQKNINNLVNDYVWLNNYWFSFFKYYNIKLYICWDDNTSSHSAIADAIKNLGGIAAYWQTSFLGKKDIECNTNLDIGFYYSNFSVNLSQTTGSQNRYYIVTGYLQDYIYPLLIDQANQVRAKLKSAGAKKIVGILDNNSLDDSRYDTGHELQRENYSYILEKVLEIPWLGVVFKPKNGNTLRYRLGPVNDLLTAAEKTGRCFVFEQAGRYQSSIPPLLAGLASDISIHTHLCGGTSALECALQELPTILIDREGTPNSKLNDLPHGKVVFKNWPETIDAIMEHFRTPGGIPGFGDWSNMINELDPFRDGQAARRMGTYLKWLIDGFDQGLERETIMADAADRYMHQWGADKVITTVG